MTHAAARKIQNAWRYTRYRLGQIGSQFNEGQNVNQLRNVPLNRLYEILLRQARRAGQDWRYERRANGLYYLPVQVPFRMTRPSVIENIATWTNYRMNNRAGHRITGHKRNRNNNATNRSVKRGRRN